MSSKSVAPCGVICDICLGFQREKNKCVGCNAVGNKPYHCTVCRIKLCPEKKGDTGELCGDCRKYPCRRIKDLEKRYIVKYGESIMGNFSQIKELGMKNFIESRTDKYTCPVCGNLLCVHRESCLTCGSPNNNFPVKRQVG